MEKAKDMNDIDINKNSDNKKKPQSNKEDKDNEVDNWVDISNKEILIKKNGIIEPKVTEYSDIYSSSYLPIYLFTKDNYYYCSLNNNEQFIHFDFSKEYNFSYFKILFLEKNKNCIPRKYYVELYDNDYKKINVIECNTEVFKEEKKDLRFTARYIHFILKENFGGEYFIIKKLEFYCVDDIA